MLERFDIQTVTETEIIGAFTLRKAAFVNAVARSTGHEAVYESKECERVGRIFLGGLRSATEYHVTLSVSAEEPAACTVKTLPEPRGTKRAEFAIIADPHVSTRCENRRARLFVESAAILRQTVAEINKRKTDFVLMPGDVTHRGTADELALAREVLDELECPLLVVPGDHDLAGGQHGIYDTFGPGQWVQRPNGFTIIGCDMKETGGGMGLGREGLDHVLSALTSADRTVILLCHRQLVPDDYVSGESRAIGDHELFAERVLPELPVGTMAYVGHKNVPARCQRGNLLQLNAPQPVEYSCGILRVRCFENGLYHNFVPLFSEVLNDASRAMGNALGVKLHGESYRRGRGHHLWNFVWDPRKGQIVE